VGSPKFWHKGRDWFSIDSFSKIARVGEPLGKPWKPGMVNLGVTISRRSAKGNGALKRSPKEALFKRPRWRVARKGVGKLGVCKWPLDEEYGGQK